MSFSNPFAILRITFFLSKLSGMRLHEIQTQESKWIESPATNLQHLGIVLSFSFFPFFCLQDRAAEEGREEGSRAGAATCGADQKSMNKEGGSEEASSIMMNHADGDDGDGGGGGDDGWLTSATRAMMVMVVVVMMMDGLQAQQERWWRTPSQDQGRYALARRWRH